MCARRAGEGIMAYNSDIVGYFGALLVLGVMLARISQLVAYQDVGFFQCGYLVSIKFNLLMKLTRLQRGYYI